jgi:hypothetical protein
MRRWVLVLALAVTFLSGCNSARTPDASASITPPAGKGLVTGGIIPCAGIPDPNAPHYAQGTVTVLKGHVTWQKVDSESSIAVFPTTVVAVRALSVNQGYSFALDPGDYVLRGEFPPPSNANPFVEVTVKAGLASHTDIPNECK